MSVCTSTSAGVPVKGDASPSKTMTRSASAASSMKWVMITMVMPRSWNSLHTRMRPLRAARVEHRRRLVKNENLRIHGQNAGNGDALLLAARKRVGFVRFESDQTHLVKCLADAQGYFRRFDAEIFRAEGDVVLNERGYELIIGVLKHHACRGADCVQIFLVGSVHSVDRHECRRRE